MNDDAIREMQAHEVAWDPLRERRVLGRIEAELDRRAGARPVRRRWIAGLAATAVAVAAGVSLWAYTGTTTDDDRGSSIARFEPPVPSPSALPAIPSLPAAAVALGDGSIATLHDGAKIEVVHQADDEVRLVQATGRVEYDVRRGLERRFIVEAANVRVTVLGTAFWVTHEPDAVRVTVEHGKVRVDRLGDGASPVVELVAELGAGDELRVGSEPTTVAMRDSDGEPAVEILDDAPPAPAGPAKTRKPSAPLPEAPPPSADPSPEGPSVDALLDTADAARARGDLEAAAAALREVVTEHRDDPRAYATGFSLAKVERARGRHGAAARAFAAVATRSPKGALAEDARAESAIAYFDAGEHDRAREAGTDYLARHPGGAHAGRIERMLQRLP